MSIFDDPATVGAAPSWRCPHCRTLQAETTRCWRCTRAAVSCASCHLFRAAVASDLGYCAADRSRTPLSGDEVRGCWTGAPAPSAVPGLFLDLDGADPPPPPRPQAPSGGSGRRPGAEPAPRPPLQELRAAAWFEAEAGRLVDAPHVAPGREVESEVHRRVRGAGRRRR